MFYDLEIKHKLTDLVIVVDWYDQHCFQNIECEIHESALEVRTKIESQQDNVEKLFHNSLTNHEEDVDLRC